MENIFIAMEQRMKGNGRRINNMVKERNCGPMVLNILDHILKEKSMVMENFSELMVVHMKDNSNKMKYMEMEFING